MKNPKSLKKEEKTPKYYHKQALRFMLAILNHEYEDIESGGMMTGAYKEGYLMGFSDAMETIKDIKIIK